MLKLSADTLAKIMPRFQKARAEAEVMLPYLNAALEEFSINTTFRLAAFLAQIAHESAELKVWKENLNYSAEALVKTWPKRFDKAKAAAFAKQPEKIANEVYGGRMGNVNPGDGWKYSGKGPIQLTFADNYKSAGKALGIDLYNKPELALEFSVGFRIAGWFWKSNGLNELADAKKFDSITKKINGGSNGKADRDKYYNRACSVLGA
jgi:putative chitinase